MVNNSDFGRRLSVVGNGKNTVASAGTAEALGLTLEVATITIKALLGNTGTIYVGDSLVASSNGYELGAGDSVSLDLVNLSKVFIDASVNSEGVSFIFLR